MSLAGYIVGWGGFIESVCTAKGRLSEPAPKGLLKISPGRNKWLDARIIGVKCALKHLHN